MSTSGQDNGAAMDDTLKSTLSKIDMPEASASARDHAFAAAMAAFDAQTEGMEQKESHPVQGNETGGRLKSIVSKIKGIRMMDIRLPMGAGLAALLVLPLGVAFLSQTALTPPNISFAPEPGRMEVAENQSVQTEVAEERSAASSQLADTEMAESDMAGSNVTMSAPMPAPSPEPMASLDAAPAGGFAPALVREQQALGYEQTPGDKFTAFEQGSVQVVAQNPVSTFSIDVDTTSYAYVRRMLEMGQLPPADAVRVEELINYFSYDYPAPQGDTPFATALSIMDSPWDADNKLIQIGIQGEDVVLDTVPPANLVLLIDSSGSMDEPDKLPLLKRAFGLLINEMGPDDTISIVTYAGSAGVVLEPTKASEKAKILSAIETLQPGGSTAGAQGIEAAYRLAEQAMIEGGTNRVLLATDGDFNVGLADPDGLENFIAKKRDAGVFLSVLGFGTGNYNDGIMQALAQAGNGNAAYIDSFSEARKVLVEEMGGTLFTIAKDVKIQVEFNPAAVSEYRLIGYETRALNQEDFNDDSVDAGEIGAGHTVTAIYEVTPVGSPGLIDPSRYANVEIPPSLKHADEYGFLKLRYKAPEGDVSSLIETPILADAPGTIAQTDADFAAAVAAFGQKLKGAGQLRTMSWDEIRGLAQEGRGDDPTGRRAEFVRLVDIAASLDG